MGSHYKACVAEMEAYGVFDVCEKQNVLALVIRGISDFGDKFKNKTFIKLPTRPLL